MFRIAIVLVLSLCAGPCAGVAIPTYPEINARLAFELPDSVQVGVPFEVRFTLETLEPLRMDPDSPHRATLTRGGGVRFISGDTLWDGYLIEKRPVALRAMFVLLDSSLCEFRGKLETMGPAAPYREDHEGPQWWRHVNYARSARVGIERPESMEFHVLTVTDSGVMVSRTIDTMPSPPSLPSAVVVSSADSPPDDGRLMVPRLATPILTAEERSRPFRMAIIEHAADTLCVYDYLDRIFEFLPENDDDTVAVEPVSGKVAYERLSERSGRVVLLSHSAALRITAGLVSRVLVVTRDADPARKKKQ